MLSCDKHQNKPISNLHRTYDDVSTYTYFSPPFLADGNQQNIHIRFVCK